MQKTKSDIQKEQRKQQIVDVALELFSKNGFHGVSVNQIAKGCGVSKGLMYSYFDSKDALLGFILEDYANKIYIQLDLNKDGVLSPAEFEHFMRSIYRMVRENTKYYKLIFALSFQEDVADKLHKVASTMMPLNYSLLLNYFKELGHKDPETEVLLFSSTLKGFLLQVVMLPEFGDLIAHYEQQFEGLLERIIEDYT